MLYWLKTLQLTVCRSTKPCVLWMRSAWCVDTASSILWTEFGPVWSCFTITYTKHYILGIQYKLTLLAHCTVSYISYLIALPPSQLSHYKAWPLPNLRTANSSITWLHATYHTLCSPQNVTEAVFHKLAYRRIEYITTCACVCVSLVHQSHLHHSGPGAQN